jgi:hypothetical protein
MHDARRIDPRQRVALLWLDGDRSPSLGLGDMIDLIDAPRNAND